MCTYLQLVEHIVMEGFQKHSELLKTWFAVGIGSPFKDIVSSQETDFHNNSMHLPCFSGAISQYYLFRLADYAVSAKGIQILWCFAVL